jgi:cellulose synthase/poly-beta-1,6-N-acetylglucosamine synthase-like glycosyltransferase
MKKNLSRRAFANKAVHLYIFIICSWIVSIIWFHPRFRIVYEATPNGIARLSLTLLIFLIELAWLYAFYNVGIVIFAWLYRHQERIQFLSISGLPVPLENFAVALLYPTYNDFVEASAYSCVSQAYPDFTVYILDDSTDLEFRYQVDRFANGFPDKVRVIRRPDRRGFKAGNLNYALTNFAVDEPFFAISDADEILPRDFLKCLVPILIKDEKCGFVQANHCCNPNASNLLRAVLGIGIDIHWRWYQPLRNKYGFVMLLGHGAVLRRECWEKIGGFPEIVSEDLAYAIRLKDQGWYGEFAEDIICYEEFPESVRSFRIRHMKWTRGTCEFLATELKRLILSKNISLVEKLDIFFPVMNLPFSVIFLSFVICASVFIPDIWSYSDPVNAMGNGQEFVFATGSSKVIYDVFFGPDFFLINFLTFIAPVLCFILELASRPIYLMRFLCHSAVLYAGLCPLSIVGVLTYLITKRADFLVTGDQSVSQNNTYTFLPISIWQRTKSHCRSFLYQSHPDNNAVKTWEIACGLLLIFYGFFSFKTSLIGLALTFLLQPVIHKVSWENRVIQRLIILPYALISMDLLVRGLILFAQLRM